MIVNTIKNHIYKNNYYYSLKHMTDKIVLNNTKNELIVIVDKDDNVIGSSTRKEMREVNSIHRVTSIFIKNPKSEKFTIQIRSLNKEYCPGYLDLVTGGIISYGEDDIHESALRELNEELGVELKSKSDLKYIGKSYYECSFTKCWSYIYYLEYEGDYKFNDGEVSGVEYWSHEEINKKIEEKLPITPDSIDCYYYFLNNNKY